MIYRNPDGSVVIIENTGYIDQRFTGICHECGVLHGTVTIWPAVFEDGRCRSCGTIGLVCNPKYFGNPDYPQHLECIV